MLPHFGQLGLSFDSMTYMRQLLHPTATITSPSSSPPSVVSLPAFFAQEGVMGSCSLHITRGCCTSSSSPANPTTLLIISTSTSRHHRRQPKRTKTRMTNILLERMSFNPVINPQATRPATPQIHHHKQNYQAPPNQKVKYFQWVGGFNTATQHLQPTNPRTLYHHQLHKSTTKQPENTKPE